MMKKDVFRYPGDDYELIERHSDGMFNFLRPDGTLVSDEWLESAGEFSEGLAAVSTADGACYLRTDGTYLAVKNCINAHSFSCGYGLVQLDDGSGYRYNFVDHEGKFLSEKDFWFASSFRDGIAIINNENGSNYMNLEGKLLLSKKYDQLILNPFHDGFGLIQKVSYEEENHIRKKKSQYAFVDKCGKIIRSMWFISAHNFHNGVAVVQRAFDRKFNYLKPDGDFLLDRWMEYADDFHEGFGIIGIQMEAYDFVDKDGKRLLNKWVYNVTEFRDGRALVYPYNNDMHYVVNTKGENIT